MSETKVCCAVKQNPLMLLLLGACPAMAVTTSVLAGLGMGLAVTAVMLLTGIVVSLLRKIIPAQVKLPVCILVAAGFTSLVQMVMAAWLPEINSLLGIYLSVVAVSALVYRHADKVAANAGIGRTVADAVAAGLFFTVVLVVVSAIRQFGGEYVAILTKPFGGYLVLTIVAAVVGAVRPAACGGCKEGE